VYSNIAKIFSYLYEIAWHNRAKLKTRLKLLKIAFFFIKINHGLNKLCGISKFSLKDLYDELAYICMFDI
jgi:hypothetical protein